MSISFRKFVSVLLVIWFPLFSGNAVSVSMRMLSPDAQMSHGACHEMDQHEMDMQNQPDQADQQGSCCADLCHLACSAYLGVQEIGELSVQQATICTTPYLFSFHSITSTPLVPPPLA